MRSDGGSLERCVVRYVWSVFGGTDLRSAFSSFEGTVSALLGSRKVEVDAKEGGLSIPSGREEGEGGSLNGEWERRLGVWSEESSRREDFRAEPLAL
jgi:hypothetical protein